MVEKTFAVLGSPISHSKSPQIHSAAYRELGLHWGYQRHEVSSELFEQFVNTHLEIAGFSLTMPLKESAYEFALSHQALIDETTTLLRAGNTLVRQGQEFALFNTDAYGVQQALSDAEVPTPNTLAILGSGATSRSALLGALRKFPAINSVTVFSRNPESAAVTLELTKDTQFEVGSGQWLPLEAAADFGGADLTINTLPSDVAANLEVDVPISGGWLFDVSYNPWPSKLSRLWEPAYCISGVEMLLWQALAQIRIFVNGSADLDLPNEGQVFAAMRAAEA